MGETNQRISLSAISRKVRNRIYPQPENDSGTRLSTQIAIEGLLAAVVFNLATAFTSMFASRLGATSNQIGLVISLPQFFAMFILIPGVLLAGRMRDRRRPVEVSVILAGLLYGLAGFSPFMGDLKVWFLLGMISLANVPIALYNVSWQNYFSDIVPPEDHNTFYTLRTSMTFIAGIVVVQIVGIVLGSTQSDPLRIWLYQGCYWLAFAVTWLQLKILRNSPNDIGEHTASSWRDLATAARELLRCRSFVVFIAISFFFHAGWYMAWPLFFLAQINYLGANESWLSYIIVSASLVQWLSVRPWGRFIRRRGIRLALFIGCFGLVVNPMLTVLATSLPPDYRLPGMLLLNLINACTFGAFQLSIVQCLLEVVPVRYKALNLSLYATILLMANSLAPLFGVQLYIYLGADLQAMTLSMIVSTVIRLIGALLFLLRWYWLRQEPDVGIRC